MSNEIHEVNPELIGRKVVFELSVTPKFDARHIRETGKFLGTIERGLVHCGNAFYFVRPERDLTTIFHFDPWRWGFEINDGTIASSFGYGGFQVIHEETAPVLAWQIDRDYCLRQVMGYRYDAAYYGGSEFKTGPQMSEYGIAYARTLLYETDTTEIVESYQDVFPTQKKAIAHAKKELRGRIKDCREEIMGFKNKIDVLSLVELTKGV